MDMLLTSVVCVCVVVMARKRDGNEWTSMTGFPISCFGLIGICMRACMHANRTNNRIHNKLHYIATILLSNIAMKAFEPAGIPKRRAAGVEKHNPGLL